MSDPTSHEPAPDGLAADEPAPDEPAPDGSWRHTAVWAAVALTIGAMTAVMFSTHRPGHWWGDDWALYINQAKSLVSLTPGEVTADNLFTVDNSLGPPFSPPLYPWGFPIILAPFVYFVDRDVDQLAMVPVLCSAVFSVAWFLLARRRIGPLPALVGMVAVSLTPLLLGWTELIQSEWPFLAVTGVVLVGIDRLSADDRFVDLKAATWPLVIAGLGATAAFSVRREGLAIVAAIAAAQLAGLIAADRGWWRTSQDRAAMALRLLTPHLSALASVLVLQIVLPSTLVPRYSGTSIANVWRFRSAHIEHLAEVSGFKRTFAESPEVLGSTALGWTVVVSYLVLALAGMVLAVFVYRRRDLHLVAYIVGALLIGGSFRSAINRYVVTIGPLLLLLAISTVFALSRRLPWRFAPPAIAMLLLSAIAAANVVHALDRADRAREVAAAGAVEWGPTHPDSLEMYEFVIGGAGPNDVVAAPKARAMTLVTGQRSIQVDDYRPIPEAIDLRFVVVERTSDLYDELRSGSEYREVFTNERFAVFEPIS